MKTNVKLAIGGAAVLALLGYWWTTTQKKSAGGLAAPGPTTPGLGMGSPAGVADPTGVSQLPMGTTSAPTPSGGPPPTLGTVASRQASYTNPMTLTSASRLASAASMQTAYATQGAAAPAVEVQGLLNQIGAVPGVPMTGVYDPPTTGAVASFQRRMQTPATGVPDSRTVANLRTMAQAVSLNPGGPA